MLGGRHGSMVSSSLTILWPRVPIACTPSMLFQFEQLMLEWVEDENKRKRGRDWHIFFKANKCHWRKSRLAHSQLIAWLLGLKNASKIISNPFYSVQWSKERNILTKALLLIYWQATAVKASNLLLGLFKNLFHICIPFHSR